MRNSILLLTLLFTLPLGGCDAEAPTNNTVSKQEIADRESLLIGDLTTPVVPTADEQCQIWGTYSPDGKVTGCGYSCPSGTFGICTAKEGGGFDCAGGCSNAAGALGGPVCANGFESKDCPWLP